MGLNCLDNHILIWGVRGVATAGQEAMVHRAKALFDQLADEEAEIMVPSVVVSEFLAGVPEVQHQELLQVMQRRFRLPPFDVLAAAKAAVLWREVAARTPDLRAEIEERFPGTTRVKIKADVQILATALVRKANALYTHDGPLQVLARGKIEVREMPSAPPVQGELLREEGSS